MSFGRFIPVGTDKRGSKPDREKRPHEMTDDELLRRVFPEELAEELKRQTEHPDPDKLNPKG